jgi:hypothetical protein
MSEHLDEGLTRKPSALRDVPMTGVIHVMAEAQKAGYTPGDRQWANFGQGQPDTSAIPGAPEAPRSLDLFGGDYDYSPVAGLPDLRDAVAQHFNRRFRRGLKSQYTAENVCIAPGGRSALTRVAAALGQIHLGHFLPDYTAYEELLGTIKGFVPIPILLNPDDGYQFSPDDLEKHILGSGLSAVLASNPCNPTGKVVGGEDLSRWIEHARQFDCLMILDEFYSHYVWTNGENHSAAAYVEDVNADPVVILGGLTKDFRLPGWRVAWTLGPKAAIRSFASAGSFLDGGAARPLQKAAIPLLEQEWVDQQAKAIRAEFGKKRIYLQKELTDLGVRFDRACEGSFYLWGDLRHLPEGINTGLTFFRKALEYKVISVPGMFFDVDPGKRRAGRHSRFHHHMRFSFGPCQSTLETGVSQLKQMLHDTQT